MDWEREGLLEGLAGDAARDSRRRLLDELHADGVPVEELRAAVAEDRLALLPVERLLGGEPRYTAREVAEESGMDLEFLQASRQALGLAVPDPDERVFGDEDVEAARIGVAVRTAGFDFDHVLETNRVLGRGMARYSDALRTLATELVLEPGADEREVGRRFAAVAARLSKLAGEVVEPPVRLVKVIGDAVMLVGPRPRDVVACALTLVERAEADDGLPSLRAGVAYGPAVNRAGDWFGSTVNLASRLTARARPGSVLTTEDVHDAAAEEFAWSFAGEKRLKGISAPVTAYRPRPPEPQAA